MENTIKLIETVKNRNKVIYRYEVTGDIGNYLLTSNEFFIEYAFSVQQIPESILNVPFVCNILPLVWIMNARLVIEELDEDFIECLDHIKESYTLMYPDLPWNGALDINKCVKTLNDKEQLKSLLFFSGGVDSFSTLISVLSEKPLLATLWGTDIFLSDEEGWENVDKQNSMTSDTFGLPYTTVKSSFRRVLNYERLNADFAKPNRENWWHGFQHGIAIISHAAPIAFYYGINRIYFSATASAKSSEDYVCASTPIIDNYMRFCGCRALHEGFEDSRDDKVNKICEFSKKHDKKINMRVCWETRTGFNCCKCEKCIRTILEILAAGYDPNDYGFDLDENGYDEIVEIIKENKIIIPKIFWSGSINRLCFNKELQQSNPLAAYVVERFGDKFGEKYKKPFIPTRISVACHCESAAPSDTLKDELKDRPLIFRNKPDNSSFGRAVSSLGMNTGNMVFLESIKKNLGVAEIPFAEYMRRQDELRNNPVVTTDLIWITANGNYDFLINQMESMKYQKMVPLGVGIQAGSMDSDFKLNASALKMLNMMQERSTLGVRGEFTARILEKNGINNLQIIGCPSLYFWGSKDFVFEKPDKTPAKVVVNFRTIYGELNRSEKHFLTYCANRGFSFLEQTQQMLRLENVKDSRYFDYVGGWLSRNTSMFFDVERWSAFVKDFDFSMGGRFHGNVIALWNKVPALFISPDARTEEMLRYLALPFIKTNAFDDTKPLSYYYEMADYSRFNAEYKEKYESFSSFIEKSGLGVWGGSR